MSYRNLNYIILKLLEYICFWYKYTNANGIEIEDKRTV